MSRVTRYCLAATLALGLAAKHLPISFYVEGSTGPDRLFFAIVAALCGFAVSLGFDIWQWRQRP